jgi:hypothetical protein
MGIPFTNFTTAVNQAETGMTPAEKTSIKNREWASVTEQLNACCSKQQSRNQ